MLRIQIKTTRTPDGCLIVTNRVPTSTGYIRICIPGGYRKLHQQVYRDHNGHIPDGQLVRHLCDNKLCVEPTHLVLGTHKQNAEDAMRNGRIPKGRKHYAAKLTQDDVDAIRASHQTGEKITQLAKKFGVSHQQVSKIVNNQRWRTT